MSSATSDGLESTRPRYEPENYDDPLPGATITLRALSDLVMKDGTEIRIVNGVETPIISSRPLIPEPTTPEISQLLEDLEPDPAEVKRIEDRIERFALKAYVEEQELADDPIADPPASSS